MNQGQISRATLPARTVELMAGATLGGKRMVGYSKLHEWPALAPAVAVHLNMKTNRNSGFCLPVKLMRKCGMRPELGVNVAVLGDRILVWGDSTGGMYRQDDESKQFWLPRAGVGPRIIQANSAIIEGPDYLVITTKNLAVKTAGAVPVYVHESWDRLNDQDVASVDGDFDLAGLRILGWSDVTLFYPNCRAKSGVANVAGRLWWQAGIFAGDPVRFTRYNDVTVVELCDPAEKHSAVSGSKTGIPRHFIGATLFDTQSTDAVRVVAVQGKLLVTRLDSALAQMCESGKASFPRSATTTNKQSCMVLTPAADAKTCIPANELNVVAWKDYQKGTRGINIYGRIWTAAGFELGQPARLVEYTDGVVVEACSEADMHFRVGTPSQDLPYRDISLVNTVLARASKIRVLVAEGRVVLTTRNSDIGRRFRHLEQWPNSATDVAEFLARLGRDTKAPAPAVEVSCYAVPEGRRLQIQGKWLQEFGFTPGVRYEVAHEKGGVRLRLAANGGAMVTEHSPGRSKVYVPSQTLDALNASQVRVMGRKGELVLQPLAA